MGKALDIVLPMMMNQLSQQAARTAKHQQALDLAQAYNKLLNQGEAVDPTQQGKIDAFTQAIEASGQVPSLQLLKKDEVPIDLDAMATQFPEYAHTVAGIKLLAPKAQQIAARQLLDNDMAATMKMREDAINFAPLVAVTGIPLDTLLAYNAARKIDPALAESRFPKLSGFNSPIIQDVLKKMDTGDITSEDQLTPSQRAEFIRLKIDPANVGWMFSGTKGDTGKMVENAQKFMTGEMAQHLGNDPFTISSLMQSYLDSVSGKKDTKGNPIKFDGTPDQKTWISQNIEPVQDAMNGDFTWHIKPSVLLDKVREMNDRIETIKTEMSGAGRANDIFDQLAKTDMDEIRWSEVPRKLQGTPYNFDQIVQALARAWGADPKELSLYVSNRIRQENQ